MNPPRVAPPLNSDVAVIGGGPAGLMAAQELAAAGFGVDLYDAMPSVGRKFLLAGKGGLNLTHDEPLPDFIGRFGARAADLQALVMAFGPTELRAWAAGLGIETFVGSSRRVFPADLKAAPLLRAWLHRLREQGVRFHMRHRWLGWDDAGALAFDSTSGRSSLQPATTVLALGGASWSRLGSDGAWWPWLQARGVDLAPLLPANCGFDVAWSEHLRQRHAGEPLKSVAIAVGAWRQRGEFVVTAGGVEGSLVLFLHVAILERQLARDDLIEQHAPGRRHFPRGFAIALEQKADRRVDVEPAHGNGHLHFGGGRECAQCLYTLRVLVQLVEPAWALGREIAAEHDVLARFGHGTSVGRLENVVRREHQHAALELRLVRQRHVHRHLVAVEVGVERRADQRMNTDGLALDEHGLERLNTEAMERGRAIEQHRMVANDLFENLEHLARLALHDLFGALDGFGFRGGHSMNLRQLPVCIPRRKFCRRRW